MEQLAVILKPGYGCRDVGRPVLFFLVEALDGGSLQVFSGEKANEIITQAGVYDVKDMEGMYCVIESSDGMQKFLRIKK